MKALRISYPFITAILLSISVFAQQPPGILSPETRQVYEAQMDAFRTQYPVDILMRGSSVDLPPVNLTHSQMRELIENSDLSWEIIDTDKVLAFLDFYAIEHPDETACMISMAIRQHENTGHIFTEKSLPESLVYLPLVRSGMNPHYASPKGAYGNWQFKYSTARLYHLKVDEYMDERLDDHKSTIAAARLLRDLYRLYDNWPLALAAYNCGPGNVNKARKMADKPSDVADVYHYLPAPEADMYHAFVAMTIIMQQPVRFGIEPVRLQETDVSDTVMVSEKLHLGQVADVLDVDLEDLTQRNPCYTKSVIPADADNKLTLLLPEGKAEAYVTMADSIYHYKDSLYFNLKAPGNENKTASDAPAPRVPGGDYTPVNYTIKSGDNIGFLAEWFDTPATDIRYWNGIRGNMIRAGQSIVVYVPNGKLKYYAAVDKLSFAQKQAREGKIVNSPDSSTPTAEELKPGEYVLYTVKSGDNPWQIAKQYPGVSDQDILRWNGIGPRDLKPGQKLKIKKMQSK